MATPWNAPLMELSLLANVYLFVKTMLILFMPLNMHSRSDSFAAQRVWEICVPRPRMLPLGSIVLLNIPMTSEYVRIRRFMRK